VKWSAARHTTVILDVHTTKQGCKIQDVPAIQRRHRRWVGGMTWQRGPTAISRSGCSKSKELQADAHEEVGNGNIMTLRSLHVKGSGYTAVEGERRGPAWGLGLCWPLGLVEGVRHRDGCGPQWCPEVTIVGMSSIRWLRSKKNKGKCRCCVKFLGSLQSNQDL